MMLRRVGVSVVAVVVAATALTGCSAIQNLAGGGGATRDDESQEVTDAGSADVFTLRVGDCFDDTADGLISEVPAVPCDQPHDNEIYYSFELPDGDWPGQDGIDAAAAEQCSPQFDSFVGIPYDSSRLDWFPITPTEDGWNSLDDREILCVIWDPQGQTTGTLAGVQY